VIETPAGEVVEFEDVAIGAVAGGRHVRGVLARADGAVVARRAVVGNARVIENRPGKVIEFDDVTSSAVLVVWSGRHVIHRLTGTDHIVVTSGATVDDAAVIVDTRGKGARGVTNMTILGSRHVVDRLTKSRAIASLTMTLYATGHVIGMVKDTVGEVAAADTMAHTAIDGRWHVVEFGSLAARINTIVIVVTAGARLHAGVHQAVAEYAAHIETRGAVADTTIDGHVGMSYGLPLRTGTVVAAGAIFRDVAVVYEGILEIDSVVASDAIRAGHQMAIMLADSCGAVVARGAGSRNIGMIELAVRAQFQKAGSGVTVVALAGRRDMELGFADGRYAVMTGAAITENFQVIDETDQVESESGMTGLTQIAGGKVIPRFGEHRIDRGDVEKTTIVTLSALGGIWGGSTVMNPLAGVEAIRGDFDGGDGALAGDTAGGDHQLHHISAHGIGDETRIG